MRTVSTIFGLTMVACLAAATACTVNSTNDGDDTSTKKDAGKDAKATGDDDDTTGDDLCDKQCAASAGAKCDDADSCVSDCEAVRKDVPTTCKDESDALYECAAKTEKADWKCSSGKAKLDGACEDEALALAKCVQDAAGDDDDDTTGDACDSCISSKCSDELTACQGNADCVTLAKCIQNCDPKDDACPDQCATDNPDGVDDANAFGMCVEDSCATECAP